MPKTENTSQPYLPWEATFANELQRRREAQGISQSELARRAKAQGLNIWQSAVGRIEAGDRQVTLNEALTLANVLGADPMEMASFAAGRRDEIDLAILSTVTAQHTAATSFEAVNQSWQNVDDAEIRARHWYLKATEAGADPSEYSNLGDALDSIRAMARALETFLNDYSDENMNPLVGYDPEL